MADAPPVQPPVTAAARCYAQGVKQAIRQDINTIYQLVEGVSLFDMLMSFATLCTASKGFSRPIFEAVRGLPAQEL